MTETDDTAFDDTDPTPDEVRDAAAEAAEAEAVDAELGDPAFGSVEPGSEGPEGTGIEGADDALLADTEDADAPSDSLRAIDEFTSEETAAAEQGNRFGDEMVSEGDDDAEVAELDGDDLDVDALADDGVRGVDVIDGLPQESE